MPRYRSRDRPKNEVVVVGINNNTGSSMKTLSKLTMAQVLGVNRLTIYSWVQRGCPCGKPEGPGKPARMDFKAVLQWRLAELAERDYYTEDGLRLVETQARAKLKELSLCK